MSIQTRLIRLLSTADNCEEVIFDETPLPTALWHTWKKYRRKRHQQEVGCHIHAGEDKSIVIASSPSWYAKDRTRGIY